MGQGDSLGGGVWKKRLDKNRKRAIVLTKVDRFWVYVLPFTTLAGCLFFPRDMLEV